MGRRADTPHTKAGREIWKALEQIERRGHSRDRIFRDWLDIMLTAYLSQTAAMYSGSVDLNKPDTFLKPDDAYEREYMAVVERYTDEQPKGSRAIDYFVTATAALMHGVNDGERDPLGDVYMAAITSGEHGQYFTPEPVADLIAQATLLDVKDGQTVADPSGCGSGVMLIAAARVNPNVRLLGIDLDERCAKMCTINLALRELSGSVYWGNGLTGEMYTRWNISHGWITRDDKPEPLNPKTVEPEEPQQLALL